MSAGITHMSCADYWICGQVIVVGVAAILALLLPGQVDTLRLPSECLLCSGTQSLRYFLGTIVFCCDFTLFSFYQQVYHQV